MAVDISSLGLQHSENHKHCDVLDYFKVVGPIYKKGGTSDIFVVRRRTQPRTRFGRWISHMKVDGSAVSLYSAALHAPQIPFGILDGSEFIHSDEPKQTFAIKRIRKDLRGSPCCLNSLKNEAQLLKQLDHPNIIRIFETFDKKKDMYLVLEFCSGGDLHQRAPYTERNAVEIVKKILLAVHRTYSFMCPYSLSKITIELLPLS
jgi:serine/threonine protein kinase